MLRFTSAAVLLAAATSLIVAAGAKPTQATPAKDSVSPGSTARHLDARVQRGRALVMMSGCGDCHGGYHPGGAGWLAGVTSPAMEFAIGPFKTRPRNITPDNRTGIGRFTERQLFNALRYGLRPGETPDVDITSTTPGQGNFPANPKYLAPPMPWVAYRHMPDEDIRDIATYLKVGVKPVTNVVADSEGPPDFWAGEYTVAKYGPYPGVPYPSAAERSP